MKTRRVKNLKPSKALVVSPQTRIVDLAAKMRRRRVDAGVVVIAKSASASDDTIVGIVTDTDIMRHFQAGGSPNAIVSVCMTASPSFVDIQVSVVTGVMCARRRCSACVARTSSYSS